MTTISVASRKDLRCSRCGGNAYLETLDEPELRCLQCSRLIAQFATEALVPQRRLPAAA